MSFRWKATILSFECFMDTHTCTHLLEHIYRIRKKHCFVSECPFVDFVSVFLLYPSTRCCFFWAWSVWKWRKKIILNANKTHTEKQTTFLIHLIFSAVFILFHLHLLLLYGIVSYIQTYTYIKKIFFMYMYATPVCTFSFVF